MKCGDNRGYEDRCKRSPKNLVQKLKKGVDINIDGYLGGIKEFESLYNFFATF